MKTPFTGEFFAVTPTSLYRVCIVDLVTSPIIEKVALADEGHRGKIPVGGKIRGFFYAAITSNGIYKYRAHRHQTAPVGDRPPPIAREGEKLKGPRTGVPVAFIRSRELADDCLVKGSKTAFDPRWLTETLAVIEAIGPAHPLVTVLTEGEFAVPLQALKDSLGE